MSAAPAVDFHKPPMLHRVAAVVAICLAIVLVLGIKAWRTIF